MRLKHSKPWILLLCLWLGLFPCKTTSPLSAGEPEKIAPELDLVPGDAIAFAHIRVADILETSIGKQMFKGLTAEFQNLFEDSLGVPIEKIDRVTLWAELNRNSLASPIGVIITTKAPFSADKIKANMFNPYCEKDRNKSFFAISPTTSMTLPDNKTIIILSNGLIPAKGNIKGSSGNMDEAIKLARQKHPVIVSTQFSSVPEIILQRFNVPKKLFEPLLQAKQSIFRIDIKDKIQVAAEITCKNNLVAKDANISWKLLMGLTKEKLSYFTQNPKLTSKYPEVIELKKLLENSIDKQQISMKDNQLQIALELPFTSINLTKTTTQLLTSISDFTVAYPEDIQRKRNGGRLTLCMWDHFDNQKHFPSAAMTNKKNKKLLSWRVALLPYLNEVKLYQEFKQDEPWDSEHNIKLLPKMPEVFKEPGEDRKSGKTHWQVFVGNRAAFEWFATRTLRDFEDGTNNTVMLAYAKKPIPWTKPEDIDYDPKIDTRPLLWKHSKTNRFLVVMADGSVRTVTPKLTEYTLKTIIVRNDGMVVGSDFDQ